MRVRIHMCTHAHTHAYTRTHTHTHTHTHTLPGMTCPLIFEEKEALVVETPDDGVDARWYRLGHSVWEGVGRVHFAQVGEGGEAVPDQTCPVLRDVVSQIVVRVVIIICRKSNNLSPDSVRQIWRKSSTTHKKNSINNTPAKW